MGRTGLAYYLKNCPTRLALRRICVPQWVRLGKPRVEHNESALPQIADIRAEVAKVCVGPDPDSSTAPKRRSRSSTRARRSFNLSIAVLIGTRARRQVARLTKKVSVVPADAGGPGRQAVSLWFSTRGAPSSASRPMRWRPVQREPRAVLAPVKAWPGSRDAGGKTSATASLDGPCARRVCTRRPGRRNGCQARTKVSKTAYFSEGID